MQLILLTAGKGSRLPVAFRKNPKCLVKIKSKSLIEHNIKFINKFKNKIAVCGYKNTQLKKITKLLGFKNIINKKYRTTNMVYSLFLSKKFIVDDAVIIYGDIVFNKSVFRLLKKTGDIIPVNANWLNNWKNRMTFKKILTDAEDIKIKNNKILEIGKKLKKDKLPKFQFMGIIKLKKESYMKCYTFFNKLKNNKIDMTNFINLCIKNKILKPQAQVYNSYWYEIDTINDFEYANKEMQKW